MAVRNSRSLEKSLFSPGSRKFFRLKSDQVRLLFIGLVLNADDFGRLEGDVDDLVAMFPRMGITAVSMSEHIKDMTQNDLITQYKVNGDKYIEINNFVEHQEWHGISDRRSKIPPNPASVLTTANGGRRTPVATVAEFYEKSAATPKEDSLPTYTNTKEAKVVIATNADDAYRQAKRIFRAKVGKSIGSLSNRASQWEALVNTYSPTVVIAAVEIWATELGKGGRNLGWPLTHFLKNSQEFIEVVNSQNEQIAVEEISNAETAAAFAADAERARKENEEFLAAEKERETFAAATRGQF
jgi:hypothetical protein